MSLPPVPDPSSKIRIAIALCALTFKPANQSYESYVLDLRDRFPDAGARTTKTCGVEWRERALEYERKFRDLKEKYDGDKIELMALRMRPSSPSSSTDPTKKKGKKRPQQRVQAQSAMNQTDLQGVLNGLDRSLPCVSSGTLLAVFQRLTRLSDLPSIDNDNHVRNGVAVIFRMTKSALNSLASLLNTILPKTESSKGEQATQVLNAVDALLDGLLLLVFDLVGRLVKRFGKGKDKDPALLALLNDTSNQVLGALSEFILVPSIRSFWPLCENYMSVTFGRGKEKGADIRMGMLAMLKKTLSTVYDFADGLDGDAEITSQVQSLRHRIALEVIRELARVYDTASTPAVQDEWSIRTKRLARKEVVWVLCDILRDIFASVPANRYRDSRDYGSPKRSLLRDEVLEGMAELARRVATEGETEMGMVLGVIERGWMSGIGARRGWTEVEWS